MKETKICVIGLGYVGLPLARLFSTKYKTVGFDMNAKRCEALMAGHDATLEVSDELLQDAISNYGFVCTSDIEQIRDCNFYVVAVPTPVDENNNPDLSPLYGASTTGKVISKGDVVVYESTVYPGVTEDECIPVVEKVSGMKFNEDFFAGYSPERINPGDKVHRLDNIKKIVSGCDEEALATIKAVYDIVIEVGTFPVSNLRTAEAVKVVENSQRDINIAFMNELAMVFDKMDIDTNEVVDGMNTKWNALGFRPGLVGGHCIGVDPYYFTYQAEKLGYHSQIILNGRIVNDNMGKFVADAAIKNMIAVGQAPKKSKVVILGLTFKENCPDTRNSKVDDIIKRLNEYEIYPVVVDPWASEKDAMHEYGVALTKLEDVKDADCVIVAVAHNEFKALSLDDIKKLYKSCRDDEKVLIDVKGLFKVSELNTSKMKYWRL